MKLWRHLRKCVKGVKQNLKKMIKIFRKIYSTLLPTPTSWETYKSYIKISPTAIIDPVAFVKIFNQPDSNSKCLEIGEDSHIFCSFNFVRPQAKVKIGKRCQIGKSSFTSAEMIEVGDDVLIGWGVTITDNNSHALDWEHRKNDIRQCYDDYKENPNNFIKNKDWSHVKIAPVCIKDRVWISFNTVILKGVTIGENSVIGAQSVVTRDVPPYSVVAGNPAKVIKKLESKIQEGIIQKEHELRTNENRN